MGDVLYDEQFDAVMRNLESARRWDLILRFAGERLASLPDCPAAHGWSGLAALRGGDLATAALHAAELQAHEPDEAWTFQLHAELRFKQGRIDEARAWLEEALARWPDNADFHQMLSGVHILRNDESAAARAATQSLRLNPNNLPARLASIVLKYRYAYRAELVEQEIAELEALLSEDPNHSFVLAQIGEIYLLKLSAPAKAIVFLEQALASNPHHERIEQLYHLARRWLVEPVAGNLDAVSPAWPDRPDLIHNDAVAPVWPSESTVTYDDAVTPISPVKADVTYVDATTRPWTDEAVEELLIS